MHVARKENGAVMVEFALALPILLMLVLGMAYFGLAFNFWIDETHLTREAARYAAVDFNPGPGGSLQQSIQQQADTAALRDGSGSIVGSAAQLCITYPAAADGSSGEVGDPVQATMTVDFNFIPFLADVLGGTATIPVTASATMRLEAPQNDVSAGCS